MIYFTSDLHLGHKNIIKYCQRPYSEDEVNTRMVEDILKMFDDLPSGSTVYNLGDLWLNGFIFHKGFDGLKEIVTRMKSNNKRLILILGNHDFYNERVLGFLGYEDLIDFFKDLGFDIVSKKGIELRVNGYDPIYLCHCPEDSPIGMKVFHGHTHEKTVTQYHFDEERDLSLYYNVCLDYNKKIISLQEVLENGN
jgi:calcineurin-like phosphoesterase family protein